MALTHKVTRKVNLPHEEGQWVEVRMPSLAILDKASRVQSRQAMELVIGLDLDQLAAMRRSTDSEVPESYDSLTLLQHCIIAWSYEDPVTPENISELDAQTVKVLIDVLLPTEPEADRKKGSGSSMRR